MMRQREAFTDANAVAYLHVHGGMRLVMVRPMKPVLSYWGALFTWSPWGEPPPAQRIGDTIYVSAAFAVSVDFYLNSYRKEARERLAERRDAA
jgi:hypothetical protein